MKSFKQNIPTTLCLTALLAMSTLAGCESDGTGDDDDWYDRGDSQLPDQRDDDRNTTARLPRDARLVISGDDVIRYRAPEDGTVYLYDAEDKVVIDSPQIRRGREYIVAPDKDRAWIDEDRVLEYDFPRGHENRIYFLSSVRPDDRDEDDRDDDNRDNDNRTGGPAPFPDTSVSGVPKSSTIQVEGRGDLSFKADGTGTVYVYDVQNQKVIATHRVKKNQRFTVSPENGNAAVDGKQVFKKSMNPKLTYRLYFNLDI